MQWLKGGPPGPESISWVIFVQMAMPGIGPSQGGLFYIMVCRFVHKSTSLIIYKNPM